MESGHGRDSTGLAPVCHKKQANVQRPVPRLRQLRRAESTTGGRYFWWNLDKGQFGYRIRSYDGEFLVLDSNDERQVYAISANSGTNQMWNIYPEGDDYCVLLNVATGLALDSNHTDVYTQRPNNGPYQRWKFIEVAL